ncbi:MAG: type I phosphomannose isomerase catalytic subunit [Verrucomicrobiales bacterium]
MDAPLTFQPVYMERPWGGRSLQRLYARPLPPPPARIGESWEIVDRDDCQSVVAEGALTGVTLHTVWRDYRREIFGEAALAHPSPRFPLLLKILDAAETLSIQVHPPAEMAVRLGGEPKTEMWYVAEAAPDSALFVGVRPGVDRERFRAALADGTVADLVPRLPVRAGDSIFIPSGRLHAIGAGLVIFEIQQNSDTTYRVFDWNRTGLDGRPRALHIEESLACIDFDDTSPTLNPENATTLADCGHFRVNQRPMPPGRRWEVDAFRVVAVTAGSIEAGGRLFTAGQFLMIPQPRSGPATVISGPDGAHLLEIELR